MLKRCLWVSGAAALLLSSIGVSLAGADVPAERPEQQALAPSWAEINPLAVEGEPVLVEVSDSKAPLPWKGGPEGLALVCFGGEGIAVSCEQTYLHKGDAVTPVLQKGVQVTAVLRIGKAVAPGAKVSLIPQPLRTRRREIYLPLERDKESGKILREVVSDKAGRFTTPQLAPGDYLFQVTTRDGRTLHHEVRVPRPEALRPGRQAPAQPAPSVPTLDLGEFAFPEGVTVQIWVTSRDGRALSRATVGMTQGPPMGERHFFESHTNGEGKAALAGLNPAGEIRFSCEADGFTRFEEVYSVPPPTIQCVLDPLARLEGLVLDMEGEPVAGATVSARGWGRLVATGKDGRFVIPELEPARYELAFAAPGFRVDRRAVDILPGETRKLQVELQPGQEVRGLLRDAGSEEPISGASITSTDPPGAVSTASDAEGLFDFTTSDEGSIELEISAEGYPRTPLKIEPARIAALAAKDEPLVVELKEGGRVRLIVWDEEADTPCSGCEASLLGPGGSAHLVTNGQGEALSEPLAEGEYNVLQSGGQSRGVEVRVEGNATKRVQIVPGRTTPLRLGEPRPTLEVHFRPRVPEGWTLSAEAGAEPRNAQRLPDGGFKLKRPVGGPITLRIGLADGLRDGTTWVDQAVLPEDYTSPVLDLPLPQGGVRGRLVRDGEIPVAGRLLEIFSTTSGTRRAYTVSRGDGSFLIPFLPAGVYAVVVDGQAVRPFSLEDGADLDFGNVPLPTGSGRAR